MTKLLISLLAAVLLLTPCVPLCTVASDETTTYELTYDKARAVSAPQDELYATLFQGMAVCDKTIDISDFGVRSEDIYDMMVRLTEMEAELFHVRKDYKVSLSSDGYVQYIKPDYKMGVVEYRLKLEHVRNEAEKAVAKIGADWSDAEKAVYLHDSIVAHYNYDLTYENHDVYSFLTEGVGVCEAYTLWYGYLLERVGVEHDFTISEKMNHVWSLVNVDGEWYHADLTYDDPVLSDYDAGHVGYVSHDFLLRSDAGISETHSGFADNRECVSTDYDGAAWQKSNAPIVYLDGEWYTIIDNGICTYDMDTHATDEVYSLDNYWPVWDDESRYWLKNYSGLDVLNGSLVYITPNGVRFYHPESGKDGQLYKLGSTKNGYMYGSLLSESGRVVYYNLSKGPNDAGTLLYCPIDLSVLPEDEKWVESRREEPTCLDAGTVYYVSSLDSSNIKTETIPALGHEWAGEQIVKIEPTASEAGVAVYRCSRCGDEGGTVALKPAGYVSAFEDVKGNKWYEGAVAYVYTNGLFNGVTEYEFGPEIAMNRAMLVTVLWRAEGCPQPEGENPFTDLTSGAYYENAVIWAAEKGIVTGTTATTFAPDAKITREQLAAILYRYATGKHYDTDIKTGVAGFPDSDEVSNYAVEAMSWARSAGLVEGVKENGVSYLRGRGSATRAQVATILMRFEATVAN